MTSPLIRETLDEITQEGDPESVAQARTMLRFYDAHDVHTQQLLATAEHCQAVQRFNTTARPSARISYFDPARARS
jgi:hypothetical protein